jgi:hypothetical protein
MFGKGTLLLAILLLACAPGAAEAQSYPNRPIKMIVPFPPGGPIDVMGRLVGVPTASHLRSTIDEYVQANSSTEEAASLRDFGDRPLVVRGPGAGPQVTAAGLFSDLLRVTSDGRRG